MNGLSFYHNDIPPQLREICESAAMQRIKDVGMNCGCEYTKFPRFAVCAPYSRFDHSLGVGLIVWHFTGSVQQSIAGLLHDIATPVFAHVIDFLRGDHLTQESTEDGTREIIASSREIQAVLNRYGLCTDDVCDYHIYPIADNDTPKLSADRLEYTLGNAVNYRFATLEHVESLYNALTVGKNEFGEDEIMFRNLDSAKRFGSLAMRCSEVYVADEDRFSMQALAELLREAIKDEVITLSDLDTTEPELLRKLCESEKYASKWKRFCSYRRTERSEVPVEDWYCIDAKKRYIDPYVLNTGRLSTLESEYRARTEEFRTRPLTYYIMGY